MDDHFRPIEGYPGYRITRCGEVLSCWSRHARPARMTDTWRRLKPIRRRWGHLKVNLCRDGRKTSRPVHRLVLEVFVGPCPAGLIACHNDGNPANNCVENLRWDSYQANADDTLRHGTRARGSMCNAKLSEDEVLEIRRLRAEGVSISELASRFGVTTTAIRAIVTGKTWKHLLPDAARDGLKGTDAPSGISPGSRASDCPTARLCCG